MPLGILEACGLEHVPGTTPLENVADAAIPENGIVNGQLLKYDKSGKTILVPQPSDDPNDPLNWPRWRKELFLVAALWGTACVGGEDFHHRMGAFTNDLQQSDRSSSQLMCSCPKSGASLWLHSLPVRMEASLCAWLGPP